MIPKDEAPLKGLVLFPLKIRVQIATSLSLRSGSSQ